jgi:glutamyl-tRNA synthetase
VEAYFTGADVEQARRSGLKIVQWVPAKDFVRVSIVKPEGLKLKVLKAFAESSLLQQREGSVVQFVRVGFVKVEKVESRLRSVRVAFMHE